MKNRSKKWAVPAALALVWVCSSNMLAQLAQDPPVGQPDAVVDLATQEGTQVVRGQWRYRDGRFFMGGD